MHGKLIVEGIVSVNPQAMQITKLKTARELAAIREQLAQRGGKLVFTNGCFDLLHVGHVRYLQDARKLGDALVVALNDDASVAALKGSGRPINSEADRAEILAALNCVDYVVIFQGERVTDLLRTVVPQIYAKGGDYSIESLNGEERAVLEDNGTEIQILPLVPDKSTSRIIEKMGSGKLG
jgi:rfaE bifunctional protein nucleotidyltransferase chain/domain